MAASFSASATLMNWFSATPSASASLRASSKSDFCTRNAKLLLLIRFPQFPKRLAGRGDSQIPKSRLLEVALVERDQQVRLAIQSGLENHVVVWVTQHRPPTKARHHWFRDGRQSVQQFLNLRLLESGGLQVLLPREDRFVFDHQGNRKQQLELLLQRGHEQLPGGSRGAPQGCN